MKKIIALAAFIAVLAIGYSVAWLWAAGQASAYVTMLASADGVTTPRLACGTFGIGGFPFGFDATCSDAVIQSGDVTVTVSGLKASIEVYRPTHVLLFAQSPVNFADAFTGSRSRLDFTAAQASLRLDGWRIGRVSAVLEAPVLNDTVLDDLLLAKADRFEAHLVDLPGKHDAAAGLASLGQYVEIDNLNAPGFAIAAGKSTFEAEIDNLPDDVRTYGDADLLRRWQAAGGKYNIVAFTGEDGPNRFETSGTLGLDNAGRVEGQLKLSSKGVVERIGPMIPEQFRGLIIGGQAADGSYSQTVNIAAGVIFSGLMPAGLIPPLF